MINVWIRTAIADGSIKMGDKNVPMYKIQHPKFGWQTEEIIKIWGAK